MQIKSLLQQAASAHINSAQTLSVLLGQIRSAGKVTPAIIIWRQQRETHVHTQTLC